MSWVKAGEIYREDALTLGETSSNFSVAEAQKYNWCQSWPVCLRIVGSACDKHFLCGQEFNSKNYYQAKGSHSLEELPIWTPWLVCSIKIQRKLVQIKLNSSVQELILCIFPMSLYKWPFFAAVYKFQSSSPKELSFCNSLELFEYSDYFASKTSFSSYLNILYHGSIGSFYSWKPTYLLLSQMSVNRKLPFLPPKGNWGWEILPFSMGIDSTSSHLWHELFNI